jgi:osmotically inducible protein OsmC
MPVRKASAEWNGTLREGKGTMNLAAWQGPYSFASRFEQAGGTNPEELIAAAHAGCFSMALSAALGKAGFTPQRIATTASVTLDKVGEGFGITRIDLSTDASVPGIDDAKFQEIAAQAKANCPVSKALQSVEITLEARLSS